MVLVVLVGLVGIGVGSAGWWSVVAAAEPEIDSDASTSRGSGWQDREMTISFQVNRPQDSPRRVTRAKRPQFSPREWDGVFFENLFVQGLQGLRPAQLAGRAAASAGTATGGASGDASTSETEAAGAMRWSELIQAETLEDEVKRMHFALNDQITVAARFNSEYHQVRQSFGMLSMLFAVIHDYDERVRWKEDALHAQSAFRRAASFPPARMTEAFEFSRVRRDALNSLIRGSGFPPESEVGESVDWSRVVERSVVMQRLDEALYDKLRIWSNSENEFRNQRDDLRHESQLVAMMGQILTQEGMFDASDDSYVAYAREMIAAANDASRAANDDNFELASAAINRLGQSCDNCHRDFR